MDIETFVKESLVAIAAGIKGANQRMNTEAPENSRRTYFLLGANPLAQTLDFDIAVSATKEGGGGGGGKVNVAIVEVSLDGKAKVTHEDASRIKFSVKVDFGIS